MNRLINQASNFDYFTQSKDIQNWIQQVQHQIQDSPQNQRDFYYILISEVYAIRLKKLQKAFDYLNKISSNKEVITYEQRLRVCYYRFLQGDYEQAIRDLNFIKNSIENNLSCKKIAIDFFRRIIDRTTSNAIAILKNDYEECEALFIKGLRDYFDYKMESSAKTLLSIFRKYNNLDQSVIYEVSKTLVFIKQKANISLQNYQTYVSKVKQYEKSIPNKAYFKKKLQFLQTILEIIDENEAHYKDIDYDMIKKYVIESIENQLKKVKDKSTKQKLQKLMKSIEAEDPMSSQICFKFIGQKKYKSLLNDNKKNKGNELSKAQQSKLKQRPSGKIKFSQSIEQDKQVIFIGSMMFKINMNSNGYEERYFYFDQKFTNNKKLFYCPKKDKKAEEDDFYKLKGFKRIQFGKKSKAFQRSECDKFDQDRCFTLKIDGLDEQEDYDRNFYVQNQDDYDNWIELFLSLGDKKKQKKKDKQSSNVKNPSRMKKTFVM